MKDIKSAGSQSSSEQSQEITSQPRQRGIHWAFPLGIALAGLGSAAAVLLRGCWHRNMSWPVRYEHTGYSYQVCNNCGVKRLFNEKTFRPYGPYGYDVAKLIEHVESVRQRRMEKAVQQGRTEAPGVKPAEAAPQTSAPWPPPQSSQSDPST